MITELFKSTIFFMATTVVVFASFNTYAEEMDAQLYLNQQLASKPILKYSKPISIITKVCNTTTVRDKCRIGGGGRRLGREGGGCEPSYTEETVCNDVATQSTQEYESAPVVKSAQIQEIRNFKFDESRMVSLPEQGLFDSFYYENCDNLTFIEKVSLNITGKKGFSVNKMDSVATTTKGEVNLSGKFFSTQASTQLSINKVISLSNTINESESIDISRTKSREFTLLPKMVGRLESMAYQVTVEVPFSATVIVDGELAPNENGLRLASELLSEDERTLPFSGVLRITDVSKEIIRTVPAPKSEQCEALAEKRLLNLEPSNTIASKLLLSRTKPIAKNSLPVQRLYNEPVISAANGIGYEIISVSDFSKPEPLCGFNDLGFLNLGIYSLETRKYTNYDNGVLLSSWIDKIESFKSCWPL